MKKDIIKPNTLKGNDQINRMRGLMNLTPINEHNSKSVVELTKLGPDGKVYGIVRENHKYFIKISQKTKNLTPDDFNYMGGLQNISEGSYDSYAKATKHLNLKFISLSEALGKTEVINVLKNDNLLHESFNAYPENPKPSQPDKPLGTVKEMGKNDGHDTEVIGDAGEDGNPDVDTPKTVNDADASPKGDEGDPFVENGKESIEETEEVELTESERAIDNIIKELRGEVIVENDKLKIGTAISKISKGELSSKKKV